MDIPSFIQVAAFVAAFVFLVGMVFVVTPKFGRFGRTVAETWAQAPWVDLIIAVFTWIPWLVGVIVWGWVALIPVIIGQVIGLEVWKLVHELIHLRAARGPRIVKFLDQRVGWFPNRAGLWITTLALPVFLLIRAAEIFCYPWLPVLLGFPRYRSSEWVNVSRQKFEGLIGHDLIWCLYCDWMTGVYSLGAEMLRNVESFWCPIRFLDENKCANCRTDFPDIDGGWAPADASMQDVVDVMKQKYGGASRAWFGHSSRLTVAGEEPESDVSRTEGQDHQDPGDGPR